MAERAEENNCGEERGENRERAKSQERDERRSRITDEVSVQAVDLAYYMCEPIPPFDSPYSTMTGERVEVVPVVRVFGATPAGQKVCLRERRRCV